MIIKDQQGEAQQVDGLPKPPPLLERPGNQWANFLAQQVNYWDRASHFDLRNNLIEHIWAKFGSDHVESDDDIDS